MTSHHSQNPGPTGPQPKQAVVVDDTLYPMPRALMTARDILDQCGKPREVSLVRDYESPIDHVFADDDEVDLRQGNVFKTVPKRTAAKPLPGQGLAKLAFVLDDLWEVTVAAEQTGHSLKRLFGQPDEVRLYRDLQSPHDEPIRDDEKIHFADGPVFTDRLIEITIKVNNNGVKVNRRRMTGLQIKEAAIAQGVKIKEDFVLYPIKPDGGLGPAIGDHEKVKLHENKAFRCVSPDDNS